MKRSKFECRNESFSCTSSVEIVADKENTTFSNETNGLAKSKPSVEIKRNDLTGFENRSFRSIVFYCLYLVVNIDIKSFFIRNLLQVYVSHNIYVGND